MGEGNDERKRIWVIFRSHCFTRNFGIFRYFSWSSSGFYRVYEYYMHLDDTACTHAPTFLHICTLEENCKVSHHLRLFLFSRRYRFDKLSFRKCVRYSNVFGMVRSTRDMPMGKREKERNGDCTYAYTCMRLIWSHAHEDTLYRRPWLRLSSSLRVAWARRHLFFPRSNNSWGQPFWELAAARSYCSTVALNARLRERVIHEYFIRNSF